MRLVSFRSVPDARAGRLLRLHPSRHNLRRRERRQSRLCPSGSGTQTDARRPASRVRERRVGPGQRPLDEESWAGASVGLERFSEVGAATPAKEELREIGVQLLGSVALAAGFTERDGVVSAQLEEQGPESDE